VNFHTSQFLFYFLPISLLLHRLSLGLTSTNVPARYPHSARLTIFLLTLVFYGFENPWWLLPFLGSISFDYFWMSLLAKETRSIWRRRLCAASIFQNLALFGIMKYGPAISQTAKIVFPELSTYIPHLNFEAPPGISFYIFESLSIVIDVYRYRVAAPTNILEFFSFMAMFPRFIAGPIVRYKSVARQFSEYGGMNIEAGLFLFTCGLFLKLVFADSFSVFTAYAFDLNGSPSILAAWIGTYSFTMQLYFDFSGYSLMAIGLGRCLGFQYPNNFNRPFLSKTLREFWRRWNISLSAWLKTYLYIPLGGSWKGANRSYVNIWLTMLIGGIWHGAAVKFIVWGVWNGSFLVLESFLRNRRNGKEFSSSGLTFLIIMIGFILFRASTFSEAKSVFAALVDWRSLTHFPLDGLLRNPVSFGLCVMGSVFCFVIERYINWPVLEQLQAIDFGSRVFAAYLLGTALVVGFSNHVIRFLYFQF